MQSERTDDIPRKHERRKSNGVQLSLVQNMIIRLFGVKRPPPDTLFRPQTRHSPLAHDRRARRATQSLFLRFLSVCSNFYYFAEFSISHSVLYLLMWFYWFTWRESVGVGKRNQICSRAKPKKYENKAVNLHFRRNLNGRIIISMKTSLAIRRRARPWQSDHSKANRDEKKHRISSFYVRQFQANERSFIQINHIICAERRTARNYVNLSCV